MLIFCVYIILDTRKTFGYHNLRKRPKNPPVPPTPSSTDIFKIKPILTDTENQFYKVLVILVKYRVSVCIGYIS